uniref:Uncharacterized protein n=1 Tax=Cacopsylla melanoneura TaxID=428564 RepID=A0A8D8U0J2_9HEMI
MQRSLFPICHFILRHYLIIEERKRKMIDHAVCLQAHDKYVYYLCLILSCLSYAPFLLSFSLAPLCLWYDIYLKGINFGVVFGPLENCQAEKGTVWCFYELSRD